jgi:RHS repeat-associated protein
MRIFYDQTETGDYREARYEYNGQNRMAYSEVRNKEKNTIATSKYVYDAYGRRTLAQDEGRSAMRTLYDGFTFEVIRESEAFNSGSFTVNGVQQAVTPPSSTSGSGERLSRHRLVTEGYSTWLRDSVPQPQTGQRATEPMPEYRYSGINVALYANGEAVAINRYSTQNFTGGTAYLGKDIMGSVRGISNEWGQLEERYEYDAFGKPYKGGLDSGMNLGYTGKPYDTATGMYNYGYRDYAPEAARFTTVDPIRDGANWFAYVNNDPVNYTDPFGLTASDVRNSAPASNIGQIPDEYGGVRMQDDNLAKTELGDSTIGKSGCKVVGASQILGSIVGKEISPADIAEKYTTNGDLSRDAIVKAAADAGVAVTADYWENQLTADKLNEIKNNSGGTTYILGKADVGGGIGSHWVPVTDFSVGQNGTITYTVNGTSVNDDANSAGVARTFSSGSNHDSQREGTIVRIETYFVPN